MKDEVKTALDEKRAHLFSKCHDFYVKNQNHDKNLMTDLVKNYINYIDKICYFKQVKTKLSIKDDLIQAGILGLYSAVENYKKEKVTRENANYNIAICSYASTYIFAYVQHEFHRLVKFMNLKTRNAKKLKKYLGPIANKQISIEEVAKELNCSTIQIEAMIQAQKNTISLEISNDEGDSEEIHASKVIPQDNFIDIKCLYEKMADIYENMSLGAKERDILILLAKNGDMKENCISSEKDEYPRSFADIGEKYGVSRERIRQISEKIKEQLKRELSRNNITKETIKMFDEIGVFT